MLIPVSFLGFKFSRVNTLPSSVTVKLYLSTSICHPLPHQAYQILNTIFASALWEAPNITSLESTLNCEVESGFKQFLLRVLQIKAEALKCRFQQTNPSIFVADWRSINPIVCFSYLFTRSLEACGLLDPCSPVGSTTSRTHFVPRSSGERRWRSPMAVALRLATTSVPRDRIAQDRHPQITSLY